MRKSVLAGGLLALFLAPFPALADEVLMSRHMDVWPLGFDSVELGPGQSVTARVKVPIGEPIPVMRLVGPEGTALAGPDQVVQIDSRTAELSWSNNWIDPRVVEVLLYAETKDETVSAVLEVITPSAHTWEQVDVYSYARDVGCHPREIRMTPRPGDDLGRPMWMIAVDSFGALTFAQEDGVGGQPLVPFQNDICTVVVGTRAGTYGYQGKSWIIANDADHDSDFDGLGPELEHELGLCDGRLDAWCTEALVPDLWDVDHDGLSDGEEVIGVLDAHPYFHPPGIFGATAQMLPRWGADPRHRDMFFEIDRMTSATTPANLAAVLEDTAQIFAADGSAAPLRNPDGLDGIALHFDVGVNPTAAELAADPTLETLFGDWGGATEVPDASNYDDVTLPARTPERRGTFMFGAWQQSNDSFASRGTARILLGDGNATGIVIAHELGHLLGLAHWGKDEWGLSDCKPNYPSIMNYVPGATTFSFGEVAWKINPAATVEGESAAADPWLGPWLAADPWWLGTASGQIDWNRSGAFDPGVAVRSQPAWVTRTNGAGCNMAMADQEVWSDLSDNVAPVLVELNDKLYSFSVSGGQLRVKAAPFVANGPASSCTGDDGRHGGPCLTFSATVTSSSALGSTISSFDAVGVPSRNQIAVAYVSNGVLRVAWVTDNTQSPATTPALTWDIETVGASVSTTKAPELALLPAATLWDGTTVLSQTGMPVAPSGGGTPQSFLSLMWLNAQSVIQSSTRVLAGWTTPKALLDPAQNPLKGAETPALIQIPGKPIQARCGIFHEPVAKGVRPLALRCQGANGTWADKQAFFATPAAAAPMIPNAQPGKVALAYHAFRKSNGALLAADMPGELQIVQSVSDGSYTYPKVWYSAALTPATIAAARLDRSGPFGNVWTVLPAGNLLALHGSARMTGLKGLGALFDAANNNNKLMFLPEADGIVDEVLGDGNDWLVMDSCTPLKGSNCHLPE